MALSQADDTALVAVKVVESGYPLRGQLETRGERPGDPVRVGEIPPPGAFWVEERLLSVLGIRLGETIQLGELTAPVSRVIHAESDRGGALFQVAPRLMFNRADLARSGLLIEGSRVAYVTQLTGSAAALNTLQAWIEEANMSPLILLILRDK